MLRIRISELLGTPTPSTDQPLPPLMIFENPKPTNNVRQTCGGGYSETYLKIHKHNVIHTCIRARFKWSPAGQVDHFLTFATTYLGSSRQVCDHSFYHLFGRGKKQTNFKTNYKPQNSEKPEMKTALHRIYLFSFMFHWYVPGAHFIESGHQLMSYIEH